MFFQRFIKVMHEQSHSKFIFIYMKDYDLNYTVCISHDRNHCLLVDTDQACFIDDIVHSQ